MNFAARYKCRKAVILCWSLVAVLAYAHCAFAALVRQPYLQLVTPTSVTIVWRTDLSSPNDSRVQYGTSGLNQTATGAAIVPTSNENVKDHFVTITGLSPGTKYFYNIGTTSGGVEGGGTANHFFITAPATGPPTPFRVWALGDSGRNSVNQRAVRDSMLAFTSGNPPDLIVHLADIAYENATDSDFTDKHFAVYQDILRNTVLWPSFGNHEARSSNSSLETGPYFEAHFLPRSGEAGGVPSGTAAYYSFDYANVHFIVLDSDGHSLLPGSPMLEWLQEDLANTTQEWVVAYFHHPPYSKGTHDSDNFNDSGGRMVHMREHVLPILEAGGVDLVLAGHSHNYERSYFLHGAYGYGSSPHFQTPDFSTLWMDGKILDQGSGNPAGTGAYRKEPMGNAGAVYVVAGHGGHSVGGSGGHPAMFFGDFSTFGSVILDFNGSMVTVRNLRADGVITDMFALDKSSVTGQPAQVVVTQPAADFPAGGTTTLQVAVQDAVGNRITTDNTTQITFQPTSNGTITGVVIGTGDGSYGVPGGAETVTVAAGVARITLTNAVAETFQVAITNNAKLQNPPNQSITVTQAVAGFLAHWTFDEGAGTQAGDSSGNGHTGTLVNGPTWTAGHINGALRFNGSTQYVDIGNPVGLRFTGAMTISAWVNLDANQSGKIVSRNGNASARGAQLRADSGPNGITFAADVSADCSSTVNSGSSSVFAIGAWHHVVAVYEPSVALRIYVNGVLQNQLTSGVPASQCVPNNNLNIARRPNNTDYFRGVIDDVRIYNQALTATQVADLFDGSGGTDPAPATQVVITQPGADFVVGGSTNLGVAVQTAAGATVTTDNTTQITFDPTSNGTVSAVVTGQLVSPTTLPANPGAPVTVRVAAGVAAVTLTNNTAETFQVAITNNAKLTNPPNDSITVTAADPVATQVVITQPGADFVVGGSTNLGVAVQTSAGATVTTDNTTQITFDPTSNGTVSAVVTGTLVSPTTLPANPGAPVTVRVAAGVAAVTLTNNTVETFQVAITNNAGLQNPPNDSITVTSPPAEPATQVVITQPGADFVVGGSTNLGVAVQTAAGATVTTDNTTQITFDPTSNGTVSAVVTGQLVSPTTLPANPGAPVTVRVAAGVAAVTLTNNTAETFQVAITNNAKLTNPPNDSITVTSPPAEPATQVVITQPGADFVVGGSTNLGVAVQTSAGATVTTDNTTQITFDPTLNGRVSAVVTGTLVSPTTLPANPGAPVTVRVASGVAAVTLTNNTAETFQVAITNNAKLQNPPNDSITVTETGVDPSLLAHWTFDEGAGTQAGDSSGNGHTGTLVNGPTWTVGEIDGALRFNGTNQYVDIGNPVGLRLTGAMTISAWVNLDANQNGKIVSRNGNASARGAQLRADSGPNGITFAADVSADCSSTVNSGSSSAFAIGAWHHVVAVYEPSVALQIYVNGVLQNQVTSGVPASQCVPNNNLNIGRRPNNTDNFRGVIDDVRIYDRTLSPTDIADLFNGAVN